MTRHMNTKYTTLQGMLGPENVLGLELNTEPAGN